MSACSSLRTSLQFTSDLVSNPLLWHFVANMSSAELEMTVNMLIQIDKLVQLLESPVFTCIVFTAVVGFLFVP
jgi:hypothetical protein